MFITAKKLEESSDTLPVNWIISLKQHEIPNYEECTHFTIDNEIFILWKRTCLIPVNVSDNFFCVMLTSGSTGRNKVIKIPYERIKINSDCLRSVLNIKYIYFIF